MKSKALIGTLLTCVFRVLTLTAVPPVFRCEMLPVTDCLNAIHTRVVCSLGVHTNNCRCVCQLGRNSMGCAIVYQPSNLRRVFVSLGKGKLVRP